MDRFEALPLPQKAVIIFVLLAAVAGGYYFLSVTEVRAAIDGEVSKRNRAESDLAKLKKYEDAKLFEQLEEEEREIREQLDANRELLPDEEKIPALITSIKRQADERGLKILKFRKHERETDDYVYRVPVEMIVQGSFPVIISFYEALAQPGMRMMTVSDIQLKAMPVKDFLGSGKKRSAADEAYAEVGVGGLGRKEKLNPIEQLIRDLDNYALALTRYQIEARFTVNAFSYTGKPMSDEERQRQKRQRRRRRR